MLLVIENVYVYRDEYAMEKHKDITYNDQSSFIIYRTNLWTNVVVYWIQ